MVGPYLRKICEVLNTKLFTKVQRNLNQVWEMFTFTNFTKSKCPLPWKGPHKQGPWSVLGVPTCLRCPDDPWDAGRAWDGTGGAGVLGAGDVPLLDLGGKVDTRGLFYSNLLSCSLTFFIVLCVFHNLKRHLVLF